MRKSILAASIAALTAPAAFAGSVVSDADINLNGGMTAGYFYTTNTGSNNNENYQVSDFMVELSGEATEGVGFVGAFGTMAGITVLDGGVNNSVYDYGFQYGWLTVAPMEGLSIDAGMLATNIGYEVAPSYANPHATIAALWGGQPVYYPGVRVNYEAGDMGFYAEVNDDSMEMTPATSTTSAVYYSTAAWAAGINGAAGSLEYAVSYYNYNGYKDLIDVIVSADLAGIPVAANFDYHLLENAPVAGGDDSAYGIALYATPSFGQVTVPVRVEFLSDGNSGVYSVNGVGVDSATTLTITPTYNFSDNTFVRAELSMVSSDNKIFADDKGVAEDTKTSFAVQAGFTF